MCDVTIGLSDRGLLLNGGVSDWAAVANALATFRQKNPRTPVLEAMGEDLLSKEFPAPVTTNFVREVCRWGGYPGVAGRVLKHNPIDKICSAFRCAARVLESAASSQRSALEEINRLYGLGTPSFASKHLRFVRPDQCVVLDSILRKQLRVPFNPSGYEAFCRLCMAAAERANDAVSDSFRAADIEAAVYEHLSGGTYRTTWA